MENFGIVESILRNRYGFFDQIRDHLTLDEKIKFMLMTAFAFLGIYGSVMGASHSVLQVISSAIKLPLLFLATLAICTPSLHYFNVLFGSQQTLKQTLALTLTAITTTAVLLMSFAPITLFFLLTTADYNFFKLLNVVFFGISGAVGIIFLNEGMKTVTIPDAKAAGVSARRTIFTLWVLLYAFVGSQMAWTLSPFIGEPGHEFILLTEPGSNFYANVLQSIGTLLGMGA